MLVAANNTGAPSSEYEGYQDHYDYEDYEDYEGYEDYDASCLVTRELAGKIMAAWASELVERSHAQESAER